MTERPSEAGFSWGSPLSPTEVSEFADVVDATFGGETGRTRHRALAALVYANKLANGYVLSQRQAEVWVLTRAGFAQRDVADLLDLDASTVSDYARTAEQKVADAVRFTTELELGLYDEAVRASGHDIAEPHGAIQYAGDAPWSRPFNSGRRRNLSRFVRYEGETFWYDSLADGQPPTMHIIRSFIDYGCAGGAVVIQRLTYTHDEQGYDTDETMRVYGSERDLYDGEFHDREFGGSPLDLFATYDEVAKVAGFNAVPHPFDVFDREVSLRDAFEAMSQNLVTPESLAGMVIENQQVLATDVLPTKETLEGVPNIVLQRSETWGE